MSRTQMWWDEYHLNMAREASKASKDPSTKVGAVIVRPDKTVASMGYNGFPAGMDDSPERLTKRDEKYSRVVHGEINAILHAREDLDGYTLYTWPYLPCERCALLVITAGIKRVVAPRCPDEKLERWCIPLEKAKGFFKECGVEVVEI